MRSRNIKPGFFKNEDLAEIGPYAQLLFVGLWQLADKGGKLEDRPKRIKAEVFPYYDPKPSVETLLQHLIESKFIIRYKADGFKLLKIANFEKHQSPHHTEKESVYPDPCGPPLITSDSPSLDGGLTVDSPLLDGGNPPDSLIPDSLITDSLIPDKTLVAGKPATIPFSPQNLAELWNEKAPPEMARVNLPFKRSPKAMEKIKDALKRNPDPEWWVKVIQRIFSSPFLRGEKGWKADLDFMVRKAEEIVDGKYDGGKSGQPKSWGALAESIQRRKENAQ